MEIDIFPLPSTKGAHRYIGTAFLGLIIITYIVSDIVKLFIETEQVSTNKNLCIPLNKKLHNAEVKQFVYKHYLNL